jgi:peroxin-14
MNNLKTADERRDKELGELKDEIGLLQDLIPKMLDKGREAQSGVLADLQGEIKSLKALLVGSGRAGEASVGVSAGFVIPKPTIPAWQLAPEENAEE